ncbi:hypothetical protein [Polyangium mundeleinium]|uniref:Uncharacterized protein n=1 Tax=Polyangium mundeleinium TaxID=2995306 RepID=A0ABT5ER34_9BACT|nr:hypothetical protein [Polyangium mundeleinium]MDC0743171.1 hypothetical protein [Polyangium mundeleinium]
MNILRRVAHAVLDLEKVRCEKTVNVFRKLGLYRRILESTGTEPKIAAEIEAQMLSIMDEGIVEQHALLSRFVRGELAFAEFLQEWKVWYAEYAAWCERVTLDAFRHAA